MNAVTMRMSKATALHETGNSFQACVRAAKMRLPQFPDAEPLGNFNHRSPRQLVASIPLS